MTSKWKSIRLLTPSKLRFLEHFRLDLASLAYFAPATIYNRIIANVLQLNRLEKQPENRRVDNQVLASAFQ